LQENKGNNMRIRIVICMLLLAGLATAQGTKNGSAKGGAKLKPSVEKTEAVTTPAAVPATAEVTKELVETFLKRVYGFNQEISFKVADLRKSEAPGVTDAIVVASTAQGQQVVHFYVLPDGGHVVMGDMVPFGRDPFASTRKELESSAFGATKGPAEAPITIVEFADLQCPACKAAQTDVEKLQADFPQVKFVFQSFPLDMHPWANLAARYLDCIQRKSNDLGLNFVQTVFIHQGDITPENAKEKLERYASMIGADGAAAGVCAETSEAKDRVARSIALGKLVKISGTPSIFVNGHPAVMSDYEHVKALVEFELAQPK
jgi:protein-disulfide isomerase